MIYKTIGFDIDTESGTPNSNSLNYYPTNGYIYFITNQKVRLKEVFLIVQPVHSTGSKLSTINNSSYINFKLLEVDNEEKKNVEFRNNFAGIIQGVNVIDITDNELIFGVSNFYPHLKIDALCTGIRLETVQVQRSSATRDTRIFLTFGYELE